MSNSYYTSILDGYPCPNCEYGLVSRLAVCPVCHDEFYQDEDSDEEEDDCPECDATGEVTIWINCPMCGGTGIVTELPATASSEQLSLF